MNQNKLNIQSNNIKRLAAKFDTVKVKFTDREDTNLYNVLTGCLFRDHVKKKTFYIFVLKENNSTINLLMNGFGKNQQSIFGFQ